MNTVTDQGCPVFIGCGSLEKLQERLARRAKDSRIVLLHEKNAAKLILPPLFDKVPLLKEVPRHELDAAESGKQIETLLPLWQAWSRDRLDRNTLVVLVGGGVLCDMGGFAASVFKRGIPFVSVPTTLLAMADASVGGKTAVDLGEIKNVLGNFCRAQAVAIDPVFIATLPDAEFLSGMAEILKMLLISKRRFKPEGMAESFDKTHFDTGLLHFAVREKARITRKDFHERNLRKTLNFGHTAGHAFESLALKQNRPVPHGFAVAYGMACELYLSTRCLGFKQEDFEAVNRLIQRVYGTFDYTPQDIPDLLAYMQNDKKNGADGQIRPVLLSKYGACRHDGSVSPLRMEEVLRNYPFNTKNR
ncbi:MAG: 3-dehydroquinate synthase [Bacteroides sp.]|nr:3-dehydroquinate synthase [Ruminococcus flavefaciens]MCM1555452.1 3-dehydroquinate synthase [Bacteroides sp.]